MEQQTEQVYSGASAPEYTPADGQKPAPETPAAASQPAPANGADRPDAAPRSSAGPLLMVGSALCFSIGGVLCKVIPWGTFALNGARSLLAAMLVGAYLLVTRQKLRLNGTVALGAVCYLLQSTLFMAANRMTTAANAIVLQYLSPVWIVIFSFLLLKKRPLRLDLVTMGAVFLGIICFFVESLQGGGIAGDLVAIASGVCYGMLFIMNSMEHGDTTSSLFFGQLLTGILFCPLIAKETDFSAPVLLGVTVMGLVQIGLAFLLFSEGTKRTAPVTACLVSAVEPVLNPVLVALVCGELIGPLSLFGAVIVIASVVVYNILLLRLKPQAWALKEI